MLKNLRVLYVEDDERTQELMCSIIGEEVEEFYQAFDGEDGLKKVQEYQPDVVLTDITMPYLDGLSMAQKIKEQNPQQLIFILSAFEDKSILKGAISLGIKYFLPKPIDTDNLLLKLKEISKLKEV